MKRACLPFLLLFILAFAASGLAETPAPDAQPAESGPDLRGQYEAAAAALASHTDGFSIDDDAASPAALAREWEILSQIAADYLEHHPGAKDTQIPDAFTAISPNLQCQAVRLDPKTYLLSVSTEEVGTVFIVAAKDGYFSVPWQISKLPAESLKGFAMIGAWSAERAKASCEQAPETKDGQTCGPLRGTIGTLPPETGGALRFFVAGTYAQRAGATVGGQLTIWKWADGRAEPLYATSYSYLAGEEGAVHVRGDTLRIKVKDEFKTFFDCGSCDGRQMEHRLHAAPNAIEDAGMRSLVPELDAADELFERMLSDQPVNGLAEPEAVKVLTPMIAAARAASAGDRSLALGMLNDFNLRLKQKNSFLCLSFDGGTVVLTLGSVQNIPHVFAAKMSNKNTCPGGRSVLIREGL